MPQSLAQIYLHVVFSTKNRFPFLQDLEFRPRVHAYLAGICRNLNCPSLRTGGVDDHVHNKPYTPSGRGIMWLTFPGCAARPWALEFDRFAVAIATCQH